jgi:hypothetical protein
LPSRLFNFTPKIPGKKAYPEHMLYQRLLKMIDSTSILTFEEQLKSYFNRKDFYDKIIKTIVQQERMTKEKIGKRILLDEDSRGCTKLIMFNERVSAPMTPQPPLPRAFTSKKLTRKDSSPKARSRRPRPH